MDEKVVQLLGAHRWRLVSNCHLCNVLDSTGSLSLKFAFSRFLSLPRASYVHAENFSNARCNVIEGGLHGVVSVKVKSVWIVAKYLLKLL